MSLRNALVLALAGAMIAPIQAQTCDPNIREITPVAQFVINPAKGTVLDKNTGLTWKRCAEGLSGTDCGTGSPAFRIWGDALNLAADSRYAGHADWRLPNAKELESLVEEQCYEPAINANVFPGTPALEFWSSSPLHYDAYGALYWVVGFGYGNTTYNYSHVSRAVRLVRGGQ
jgi:hypothetical protein